MSLTISNLTTQPGNTSAANNASNTASSVSAARQTASQSGINEDKVTLGSQSARDELTYDIPRQTSSAPVQSQADVQVMLEESDRKAQEIINLILIMVDRQGTTLRQVISGETQLQADPQTIAAAQAAISEDGEWGVKQTAGRILDFARAVIGEDPARLEKVRAAVEQGFKEATEMLGGSLPEISQRTYDAVMAEFDRWREEGTIAAAAADDQIA